MRIPQVGEVYCVQIDSHRLSGIARITEVGSEGVRVKWLKAFDNQNIDFLEEHWNYVFLYRLKQNVTTKLGSKLYAIS